MINFVQSPSPGMEKRRGWVSREGESFICTLRGRKGHHLNLSLYQVYHVGISLKWTLSP